MSIFKINELVLKVSPTFEPARLPLKEWTAFLNALCGTRQYQKEAIQTALIYLFGGRYKNIEALVEENFNKNEEIARRYNNSLTEYGRKLHFQKRLSGTIDLATGTGKSFVMYGIAQIALALGYVDRVLVLSPSLTIKDGLTSKFKKLACDASLLNTLPASSHVRNPRIINADKTIKAGDICITNIHAVYSNNSSSILDSLGFGKGENCLVLSDEVHHAYNRIEGRDAESKSLKEWTKFILDQSYGFNYMLGFTGTAYIENEYFNDVFYRYSLREAIEERYVKNVLYVDKDDTNTEHAKFQKIYQTHIQAKIDYPDVKPLTILITKDIKEAKRLHTRLSEFLAERPGEGRLETIAKQKVLVVTSDKEHRANIIRLRKIDEKDEKAEWLVSVAMLTEGWDVQNVFQIVPMEEKAFNSKLLIAQVLGRGLRLPAKYPNATVKVFNHSKFADSISTLVKEILEIEQRLRNSALSDGDRSKFHFDLWNYDYSRQPTIIPAKPSDVEVLEFDGVIDLVSETFELEEKTVFVNIDGNEVEVAFAIEKQTTEVSDIVDKIIKDFEIRDWEGKTLKLDDKQYTKNSLPPKEELEALVFRSMKQFGIKGTALGNQNRAKVFARFSTLFPRAEKTVNYSRIANPLFSVSTVNRDHDSISFSALKQNATVFYTSEWEGEILDIDTRANFKVVLADDSLPRRALSEIKNAFLFKTPLDITFTTHDPEKRFAEALCDQRNAEKITAWIKSANKSFYTIPYSVDSGDGRFATQQGFNPDFFIKIDRDRTTYIVCVEIKADADVSEENKAKLKYAKEHFIELNEQLLERHIAQKYLFHFVSPCDFQTFFDYLQDDRLVAGNFRGQLEALLSTK